MNQKKIGEFLRMLRKEKGLTQEQLAEEFNVSGRTISRWETGSNMPDISIISEIADFYEIDVRELINGERKAEIEAEPSSEESDVSKVIEYAGTEKAILARKVTINSIVGLVSLISYIVISKYHLIGNEIANSFVCSVALYLVYVAIINSILFTSGRMEKRIERRKNTSLKKKISIALIIIGVLIVVINMAALLLVGSA